MKPSRETEEMGLFHSDSDKQTEKQTYNINREGPTFFRQKVFETDIENSFRNLSIKILLTKMVKIFAKNAKGLWSLWLQHVVANKGLLIQVLQ